MRLVGHVPFRITPMLPHGIIIVKYNVYLDIHVHAFNKVSLADKKVHVLEYKEMDKRVLNLMKGYTCTIIFLKSLA